MLKVGWPKEKHCGLLSCERFDNGKNLRKSHILTSSQIKKWPQNAHCCARLATFSDKNLYEKLKQ